jgi:glutathione synthase/RimK-type ligase-like ATP-grasp enzyme
MPQKTIIIITEENDAHADPVLMRLRELGHPTMRLHTQEIPLSASFSLKLDGSSLRGTIRNRKQEVNIDDVRSIWWRRPTRSKLPEGLSKRESRFFHREVRHALRGLWTSMDCYWMSFPDDIVRASWKPAQLKRAAELGFEIPRTLITSSPNEARDFHEQCGGRMIFKVMSDPFLGLERDGAITEKEITTPELFEPKNVDTAFATLIDKQMLDSHLDEIANAPCQFQQYIEKKSELRVTIIGDQIFVAEIDSQAQERTRIDWRHYDVPMIVREGHLPEAMIRRCLAFVRGYNLQYSAMDIIRTPDDRFVFLENNPNGQFLFIEQYVPQFKMLDALVNRLVRGNGNEN